MTRMEAIESGHTVGSENILELHRSRGTERTWLQLMCCTFLMYGVLISGWATQTELSSAELVNSNAGTDTGFRWKCRNTRTWIMG